MWRHSNEYGDWDIEIDGERLRCSCRPTQRGVLEMGFRKEDKVPYTLDTLREDRVIPATILDEIARALAAG